MDANYFDAKTKLARDDFALMQNNGSGKLHIVTLQARPYPNETQDKVRSTLWSGHPLCDGSFGYYWTYAPEEDCRRERCVRCFQRWRALGTPATKGVLVETLLITDGFQPPLAWREVVTVGVEGDDEPRHEDHPKLKEIRRWQRGSRYVRICELTYPEHVSDDERRYTHSLNYGWVEEAKSDQVHWKSSAQNSLKEARQLMLLGGAPKGSVRNLVRGRYY